MSAGRKEEREWSLLESPHGAHILYHTPTNFCGARPFGRSLRGLSAQEGRKEGRKEERESERKRVENRKTKKDPSTTSTLGPIAA